MGGTLTLSSLLHRGLLDGLPGRSVVTFTAMDFICPICQGLNWREVVVRRSDGSYYRTDFRECCGCSAMFRRPELFTVGRGLKPSGRNDDDREQPA